MGSIFESGSEADRTVEAPGYSSGLSPDDVRVGDVERHRVVEMLNDHFVAGRLTGEELEVRSTAAAGAVTRGQLRAVLEGLPSGQSTLAGRVLQQERTGAEWRAAEAQLAQAGEEREVIANQLLRALVQEAFPILMTRNPLKLLEVSAEFKKPLFGKGGYLNPKYRITAGRTLWQGRESGRCSVPGTWRWAFAEGGQLFEVFDPFTFERQMLQQAEQFAKGRGFDRAVFSLKPVVAMGKDPNSFHDQDNYRFFLDPTNPGQLLFGYSAAKAEPAEAVMANYLH